MGEQGLAEELKFVAIEFSNSIDKERRNAIWNVCQELPALIAEHEDVTLCEIQGTGREMLAYNGKAVAYIDTHIDGFNYSVSYEILVSLEELQKMIAERGGK